VLSAVVAASVVVAYLAGAKVDGERPPILQVLPAALLMGLMSYGMWRARYWAVLGFQAVLALLIVAASLGLVAAESAAQLAGNLALIAIAGTLFYFMIKAMARIQLPERAPRE
jgi:steroid 5-alpha reductase family enzyme